MWHCQFISGKNKSESKGSCRWGCRIHRTQRPVFGFPRGELGGAPEGCLAWRMEMAIGIRSGWGSVLIAQEKYNFTLIRNLLHY